MLKLIKNEFIKEYTIKRIIFIGILFAVISLVYIWINIKSTSVEMANHEELLENYKSALIRDQKSYDKDPTPDNLYMLKSGEVLTKRVQVSYEMNPNYDYWRDSLIGNIYMAKLRMVSLEMIKSGIDPASFSMGSIYIGYSMDQINDLIEGYQAESDKYAAILATNLYYKYVEVQIEELNDELNRVNDELAEGSKDYNLKDRLYPIEEEIRIKQLIVKNKIVTDDDKRVKEAEYLINIIANKKVILSKEDFAKDSFTALRYDNYEQYYEMTSDANEKIDNELKIGWYAMEHNLSNAGSPFLNIIDEIYIIFIFVTFIMVIRASTTITSENNSGTIKLLLTKGASRFKIAIAKILNILLSTYLTYFAFLLVFIIVGSFFFDITDLFSPKLAVIKDVVVEKSYFLWLLKNIFIVSLPTFFLGSLSFLLSIITLNGVLASCTCIFLSMTGLMIKGMIVASYMFFLKNTPLAYLSMIDFVDKHNFLSSYHTDASIFSVSAGIAILIISGALCYIISVIIFMKRDVRN